MKVSDMSGWARLLLVCWIVFGIWLIPQEVESFPTQEGLKNRFDKNIAVISQRGDKLINDRWRMSQEEFKRKAAEYQQDTTAESLTRQYFDDVANIRYTQARFIGEELLGWLAIGVLIAAAGFVGRWIVRGFRPKAA